MADSPNTPPPPTPPLVWLKRLALTMLVIVALGLGFMQLLPRPVQTGTDKDAQIALLSQRLEGMDAKVKSLEDVIAATPKPSEAADAKIAELQAKVETLSEQSADDERVKGIETKVGELQSQLGAAQEKNARQLALMAAVDELKDAINHGDTLGTALAKLKSASDGQQKIQDVLAGFSDKGVVPLAELQQTFDKFAKLALSHNDDNSVLNWHSLITIRKTGDQPGADDEAVISRAEAALGRGQLDKAVSELAALSEPAAKAFAPWVADAGANLHAHETLAALQQAVAAP